MDTDIDLKPYRLALEGLLVTGTTAKITGLLAKAAAEVRDSETRDDLIIAIKCAESKGRSEKGFTLRDSIYEEIKTLQRHLRAVLDDDAPWEQIAHYNGWGPDTCAVLCDSISEAFGRLAINVAPASNPHDDARAYWVVWDSANGPAGRTLSWISEGDIHEITEEEGIEACDCPAFFFRLAPTAKNDIWRAQCKKPKSPYATGYNPLAQR